MFKIICVTNRQLCSDLKERARELHNAGISVILREKDLSGAEYERLAREIIEVCPDVILHTYRDTAKRMGVKKIHLPFSMMNENVKDDFETVGVSVHSPEEALKAQEMGADYVIAGHIFVTDCKKGLEPRGLEYLRETVKAVSIPVYAIGGISPENVSLTQETGAAGACVMSGFMRCESVEKYLAEIQQNLLKK
ncbi:MAG: thiamine phosphate synthase [Oscillospiraceae bacterium]|nr:thiamine phosphate synthase [Oscillospiraceae bacterium]